MSSIHLHTRAYYDFLCLTFLHYSHEQQIMQLYVIANAQKEKKTMVLIHKVTNEWKYWGVVVAKVLSCVTLQ